MALRIGRAVALGVAAGFFGGLFGVGGGLIMVPGMVLLMGFAQHRAHATSLAVIIVSAGAATVPLALDQRVDWDTAALLVAGAVLGAYAGARLLGVTSDLWLARAFVILVLAAAVRMALEGPAGRGTVEGSLSLDLGPVGIAGLIGVGLVAGSVAALLGIGGGIVIVPALVALFGFEQHLAQGTSLAVIVPTAMVATLMHGRAGRVDWRAAAMLAAGGLLGGFGGARLALALDAPLLRQMFAGVQVLVAVRMLRRTRRTGPPS
ncbi:MAG TPA: sulfite exporter TauE/SafE family protein [Gemmatimonadales bacterium]|nr:sulfite exporter TauE/SafE family protein [Gemmatimonadales bacterium]